MKFIMKKLITILLIILVFATLLVSCKEKHTHNYGNWKTVKDGQCTDVGLEERECNCGEKETRTIPAGHNFVDGVCQNCDEVTGEPTSDNYFTFTELDDGTYSIAAKDVKNIPATVILPSSYNGKPITVIAENAFGDRITEEKIDYNGTTVTVQTTSYCESLSTVVIPDGIKIIDKKAFNNCFNLSKVIMGDSVTHINDYAFTGSKFKEINLSKSLKYIGSCAFMSNIEILVLPDSVTTIAPHAFSSSGLISITIPESVTEIGGSAFELCDFICEIVNNSSVEIEFVSLSKTIDIHKGKSKLIKKDGCLFYPFEGRISLVRYIGDETNLVLPSTVNGESYDIRRLAFAQCSTIKSLVIPEGVKIIEFDAFFRCESLKKLYLPKSITELQVSSINLFWECDNVTDVYYAGSENDGRAIKILTSKIFQNNTYYFEDIIVDGVTLHYNHKYGK